MTTKTDDETSMVERVARAMFRADGIYVGYDFEKAWTDAYERVRYLRRARAAITAMREPNEPMRVAALNVGLPGHGDPPLYEMIWTAMNDAALGDG